MKNVLLATLALMVSFGASAVSYDEQEGIMFKDGEFVTILDAQEIEKELN